MQKAELHVGDFYGYRANTRAWERADGPPIKVELLEVLDGGKNRIRLPDGSEKTVRSAQLILAWSEKRVAALLHRDERERGFRDATFSDWRVCEAASIVFDTVLGENAFHVQDDRGWLRGDQEQRICSAAEITGDLADLSPVARRSEDDICLPLQTVELLAKRIAERTPDAIEAGVKRVIADLEERGVSTAVRPIQGLMGSRSELGGQRARGTTGQRTLSLGSVQAALGSAARPRNAQRLLGGTRMVRRRGSAPCDRTIACPDHPIRGETDDLGPRRWQVPRCARAPTRAGSARSPADDEPCLLAKPAPSSHAVSHPRGRERRFEFPSGLGKDKTLESLIKEDLVWESAVKSVDAGERHRRGRFRLTDAGWRALEYLKPRVT